MSYRDDIIRELDFVSNSNEGVLFWDKNENIQWEDGSSLGKARADQLIAFMVKHTDPVLLTRIVEAITNGGHFGSVERGFMQRIGESLIVGNR